MAPPTDKECDDLLSALVQNGFPECGEAWAQIKKRWPDPVDQDHFKEWRGRRTIAHLGGNASGVRTSSAQFIDKVRATHFFDVEESMTLVHVMLDAIRSLIPMGIDAVTGVGYRLIPEAYGLVPQTLDVDDKETRQIVLESYLGVNTNVQPRGPQMRPPSPGPPLIPTFGESSTSCRHQNYSERSTKTTESDDATHGFVFHQIGKLEYFIGTYPTSKKERDAGP